LHFWLIPAPKLDDQQFAGSPHVIASQGGSDCGVSGSARRTRPSADVSMYSRGISAGDRDRPGAADRWCGVAVARCRSMPRAASCCPPLIQLGWMDHDLIAIEVETVDLVNEIRPGPARVT
jgi:hypothetical protein